MQARKQPALRSIINTTAAKKRKNFVDENKENNYSKILTPDNINYEMSSSKMKESINSPLEAFDIENETIKNELGKVAAVQIIRIWTWKQNVGQKPCPI